MGKIFSKMTVISAMCFFLVGCPIQKNVSEGPSIDELMKMSRTMPDNVAKQIIAEYTGEKWVEEPYLEARVSVYDKKNQFVKKTYSDKVYFEFREMLIGQIFFWGPCLHVSVRHLEFWKEEQGVMVVYRLKPKKLCQRYNESQDDLIMAFFRKGTNWGTGSYR